MSHSADTTARKSETPERIPVGVSSYMLGKWRDDPRRHGRHRRGEATARKS